MPVGIDILAFRRCVRIADRARDITFFRLSQKPYGVRDLGNRRPGQIIGTNEDMEVEILLYTSFPKPLTSTKFASHQWLPGAAQHDSLSVSDVCYCRQNAPAMIPLTLAGAMTGRYAHVAHLHKIVREYRRYR